MRNQANFNSEQSKGNTTEDVEMQQLHTPRGADGVANHHMAPLKYLFGIPESQLRQWKGATAYCRYLEECFEPLLTDEYASLWITIGQQRPRTGVDCWSWFNTVSSVMHDMKDEDSSIEDIWNRLKISTSANNRVLPDAPDPTACLVGVFAVLCWGTMTLQPQLDWTKSNGLPRLLVHQKHSDQPGLRMDFVRRPVPAVFRQFQRTMPITRWRHPISETRSGDSTALYVTSLNYATLKIIGKIHIVWVDNLSSHLDFDATNRQLSIFKFPTFCALSAIANNDVPSIFVRLLRAFYRADADSIKDSDNQAQLHQEVLMSYRLLFGQSHGAQGLVKVSLKALRENEYEYDHLLDIVCTRPCDKVVRGLPISLWPVTCRSFDGHLQEESAYSSQDDFPFFGQRLAKLQEFCLRQQPSKLRDLWRDRRNPLQWYTFWAVLVFGGLSIIIAFLQLVVGIAQLATAKGSQGCPCSTVIS